MEAQSVRPPFQYLFEGALSVYPRSRASLEAKSFVERIAFSPKRTEKLLAQSCLSPNPDRYNN
jgi:hypothetical protein